MAMGSAYAAAARDYEAAHLNPANLSLAGNAPLSVHILSLTGEATNSSLSYDEITRYSGAHLEQEDKDHILSLIEGEQLTFDVATDLAGLSVTSRGFAVTLSGAAFADGGLPRDLVELMLNGNQLGRTYDIADAAGEGIAVSSLGVSASHAFSLPVLREVVDEFAVGGTFRYMKGWYYGRITESYGRLVTELEGLHGDGLVRTLTSTSGSGAAVDLGFAARRGGLGLSLSFHDLGGRMTWHDGEELVTSFTADSVTAEQLEEGGDLIEQSDETIDVGDFEIGIPARVRLGVAYDLGKVLVTGDYGQGWGGDGLTPEDAEIAAGVEHRTLGWLRLRGGFAAGPDRKPSLSLGGGFEAGAARIDLAVASHGGLWLSQDEGVSAALGVGLLFR
jgi:hypothetical protein